MFGSFYLGDNICAFLRFRSTWNGFSLARAVFTWLSKGIGFGFGFGFTTPFGWLVYLLWFWFYDSQVKTALLSNDNNDLKRMPS